MLKRSIMPILCILLLAQGTAFPADFRFSPNPNKADLIQWREWGEAAFAEARKADKLVLLSLSAVWCHWCHVMDETSYSDERIIAFINEHFIPVRVDADLRPDVDSLYNQGGWPSTVILIPGGEVLHGGNYFPPDEFLALLSRAEELYRTERKSIAKNIERFGRSRRLGESRMTMSPGTEDIALVVDLYRRGFDEEHGGFGSGQKFPNPPALDLLLSRYAHRPERELKRIITRTLDAMAEGGVQDRVEGGFFRYATKPDWSEPHYEKMLEVNAGMVRNYAEAYQVFGRKDDLRVARRTARYVLDALADAGTGALYGSQDADERYYTRKDRKGLSPPHVDRTVYADSASLMISALVSLSGAAKDAGYLGQAEKSTDYLLRNLYAPEKGVAHASRGGKAILTGQLLDNALFGAALLDLFNATGRGAYLDGAREIGSLLVSKFYDGSGKMFRPSLTLSVPAPATAGMLADVNRNLANYRTLAFLGRLLHAAPDEGMRAARDAALMTFSGEYRRYSPHAAAYGFALVWAFAAPVEIVVVGPEEKAREYLREAGSVYVPEKVVQVLSVERDGAEIRRRGYPLREAVYLCAGKRCSAPITEVKGFAKEVTRFLKGEKE